MNKTVSASLSSGVASAAADRQFRPKLLDRVRIALRSCYCNHRTGTAYLNWSRRFILFHNNRHPAELAEAEINQFLSNPAVIAKVSASTQKPALNALLFLYRHVLDRQFGPIGTHSVGSLNMAML